MANRRWWDVNGRLALFFQAIRGPVLLMTLGLLFAIHQAGILSFAQTWPLILIVIGLLKLFERMAGRPAAFPPGGGYR
jgi:hypothetical protein